MHVGSSIEVVNVSVPPAESVCGSCVGSHVSLTLGKWSHIDQKPPHVQSMSPRSVISKIDRDLTPTLDVLVLVTNHS